MRRHKEGSLVLVTWSAYASGEGCDCGYCWVIWNEHDEEQIVKSAEVVTVTLSKDGESGLFVVDPMYVPLLYPRVLQHTN